MLKLKSCLEGTCAVMCIEDTCDPDCWAVVLTVQ